ncbi:hypothetical protein [uncultured Microbacterium sp.]|uniref:hypothetical protein n=1 Tax=uncultured Microbacterium sp. TaxID=191216 RepID=UPI0025E8FE56|nr:hypothetical protein [uncultured Microbacterium sp.]
MGRDEEPIAEEPLDDEVTAPFDDEAIEAEPDDDPIAHPAEGTTLGFEGSMEGL